MLRALIFCCIALMIGARSASAEWHISPLVGLTLRGNTSIADSENATHNAHKNIGAAVALLGKGLVGVEGIFVFTPGFFQSSDVTVQTVTGSHTLTLMGNIVLTTPRRWTEYGLRPFVSGGFGLLRASVETERDVFTFRGNLAGFNLGAGAVGFFTPRTGVRFDLRYYSTLNRSDQGAVSIGPVHLSYMTLSAGVVFRR